MAWLVVTCLRHSDPTTATSVATSCRRPMANGYGRWRDLRQYVHPDKIATRALGVDGAYFLTKKGPLPYINIGIPPSSSRANAAANHRSAPNLPTPCHQMLPWRGPLLRSWHPTSILPEQLYRDRQIRPSHQPG